MKKLHVLLLVALSTSMLLFGCGKKDDTQEPANVEDITLENEAGKEGKEGKQNICWSTENCI